MREHFSLRAFWMQIHSRVNYRISALCSVPAHWYWQLKDNELTSKTKLICFIISGDCSTEIRSWELKWTFRQWERWDVPNVILSSTWPGTTTGYFWNVLEFISYLSKYWNVFHGIRYISVKYSKWKCSLNEI